MNQRTTVVLASLACAIGLANFSGCKKAVENPQESVSLSIMPENSSPNEQAGITPVPPSGTANRNTEGAAETSDSVAENIGAVRASFSDDTSSNSPSPGTNALDQNPTAATASLSDQPNLAPGAGGDSSEIANKPVADETSSVSVATASGENSLVPDAWVDYAKLETPQEAANWTPKQWVQHLATIDRGFQALILDQQGNNITQDDFATQARRLSEMKLQASEALIARNDSSREKELGILGKLESLSQLAGLGDRLRATELMSFANENASFESKDVARQSALVLLGFAVSNLANGSGQPEVLLRQVDVILADRDQLRLPEFKMMDNVVTVLQRKGLNDLAQQVTTKTIDAFCDNPEPNIAYTVWQMEAVKDADFQNAMQQLKSAKPDPALVRQATENYFKKAPGRWFLVWLAGEIKNLEFGGHMETAGAVAEFVDANSGALQSEVLKTLVATEVDAYKLHVSLIGKRLELGELADLNGQPLNLESLRGKVVLVNYWASWCSTCRAEFPALQKLYENYRDQGLEMVFVNLDESVSAMSGVLQVTNLPGIHVRSSNPARLGVASSAAQQVGLRATPFSLLLDREGNVIKLQVHGEELEKELAALLQN